MQNVRPCTIFALNITDSDAWVPVDPILGFLCSETFEKCSFLFKLKEALI